MSRKGFIFVRLIGTGVDTRFKAITHDIIGMPADTYHKFTLEDGSVVYYNGYGVRTITIADTADGLN